VARSPALVGKVTATATCTEVLPPGFYSIDVSYSGDSVYEAQSTTVGVDVSGGG